MPYFNYLPDIKYDTKPISYPFSESDFVVAKNFFRRFKITQEFEQYAVYFKKYNVGDFEAPWQVANIAYGDPTKDWVILLTNNIFNPLFDWPKDSYTLRKYIEGKYDDPYSEIVHYKTTEHRDSNGVVVQKAGLIVDEKFYNSPEYIIDTVSDLPQENIPKQAVVSIFTDSYTLTGLTLTNAGSGYESTPIVEIGSPGNGATAQAILTSTGAIKRVVITNPGGGYEYPPIVTLGGGLEGQSATAILDNGSVSEIRFDGIKYDTTDASQIYEFGGGTSIASNGTGSGSTGGFDIGGTHLRFGDAPGTRFVTLNPVNATAINQVRVYAIRGNGSNGGETPDIVGVEDLRIQYQATDQGAAPDNNAWVDLGVVIDAVPNGSGTGVLDNYDFNLGPEVQQNHVYFRLFQQGNSGANYDHYGILSVNFIGATATNIAPSTITMVPNPLQIGTPVNASAEIILGRSVSAVALTSSGTGYAENTSVSIVGGNPDTPAQANVILKREFKASVIEQGNAYTNATVSFTGGGPLNNGGVAADVNLSNGRVVGLTFTNFGNGYTDAPFATISAPDSPLQFSIGQGYTQGNNTWRWNGTAWERQVTSGLRYYDTGTNSVQGIPGNVASYPVNAYEYEEEKNEQSREIFLLKPKYLDAFIDQFRQANRYKDSTDTISSRLKKTGI